MLCKHLDTSNQLFYEQYHAQKLHFGSYLTQLCSSLESQLCELQHPYEQFHH